MATSIGLFAPPHAPPALVVVSNGVATQDPEFSARQFFFQLPRGPYTAMRTTSGGRKIHQFDLHLERLVRGCARIFYEQQHTPPSRTTVAEGEGEESPSHFCCSPPEHFAVNVDDWSDLVTTETLSPVLKYNLRMGLRCMRRKEGLGCNDREFLVVPLLTLRGRDAEPQEIRSQRLKRAVFFKDVVQLEDPETDDSEGGFMSSDDEDEGKGGEEVEQAEDEELRIRARRVYRDNFKRWEEEVGVDVHVMVRELPHRDSPMKADLCYGHRKMPDVKDSQWTWDRLPYEAQRQPDSEEVILMRPEDGCMVVTEGLVSNVFVVTPNGELQTAPSGVLQGTMRSLIIEEASIYGYVVQKGFPRLADAPRWLGCFVCNAATGVRPVSHLRVFPWGKEHGAEADCDDCVESWMEVSSKWNDDPKVKRFGEGREIAFDLKASVVSKLWSSLTEMIADSLVGHAFNKTIVYPRRSSDDEE